MAIKIRCTGCSKKISVDEAFAGGVCRCPYCKEIVFVPEAAVEAKQGARPSAPTARPSAPGARPGAPSMPAAAPPVPAPRPAGPAVSQPPKTARPAAPGAPAAAVPTAPAAQQVPHAQAAGHTPGAPQAAHGQVAVDHDHIPMADPVMLQGLVSIILLVLLVLMIAGGVFVGYKFLWPSAQSEPPSKYAGPANPYQSAVAGKATIAGDIVIEPPVAYVVDAGGSMEDAYGPAAIMVRASVRSLKDSDKFTVLVAREDEDARLAGMVAGGANGDKAVKDLLGGVEARGKSQIARTLKTAIDLKPKTIVILARKDMTEAMSLAGQFPVANIKLVVICLTTQPSVLDNMKKFAESAGGTFRAYSQGQLDADAEKAQLPD